MLNFTEIKNTCAAEDNIQKVKKQSRLGDLQIIYLIRPNLCI